MRRPSAQAPKRPSAQAPKQNNFHRAMSRVKAKKLMQITKLKDNKQASRLRRLIILDEVPIK